MSDHGNFPNPLGFPHLAEPRSVTSPFDVAGISADIDRAIAALKPEERLLVTVKADQSGAGGALVVRLRTIGDPRILATVTKPRAGRWGWSVSGAVSFLVGDGLVDTGRRSALIAPGLRGLYRLFRAFGDWPLAAATKAIAVSFGDEVRL